jgi:hypothetical protein
MKKGAHELTGSRNKSPVAFFCLFRSSIGFIRNCSLRHGGPLSLPSAPTLHRLSPTMNSWSLLSNSICRPSRREMPKRRAQLRRALTILPRTASTALDASAFERADETTDRAGGRGESGSNDDFETVLDHNSRCDPIIQIFHIRSELSRWVPPPKFCLYTSHL